MRLLRLRILSILLAVGLVPLTLLLAGIYWLPSGILDFIWFGLIALVVVAFCIGASGSLARPVRDLALAFDRMMRSGGQHKPQSRWVPAEFSRVQRAFSVYLKDTQREVDTIEADSRRDRQKLLDSDRLVQRSFGIIRSLFECCLEGVLIEDTSGHIIASSGALDKMLDKPAEHICGRDAAKLLNEIGSRLAEPAGLDALITSCTADPRHVGDVECRTTATPSRWWVIHSAPVTGADDDVIGRLWMVRDLTEVRRLTEQLQQSQKMESIGQLAGGIAHDFNNLLTAIRGNLALAGIARKDGADEAKENIEGATRATDRAAELVKQLLGYSRKTQTGPRPCNLNRVVSDVENILRHSIDPRVTLRCEPDKKLWSALVDPVNIEQVVLNICLNARDALPESGGMIEISTGNHQYDERTEPLPDVESGITDYVFVRVKDNGCGIPEDQRKHIFDPFFSTKAPGKGTGLGLGMAQAIVQEHGGWIEFDTEVGKGTEFRVYLPKASGPAPEDAGVDEEFVDAPPGGEGETGAATPISKASSSILVVDDEDSVRSIAVSMLKHLGYEVTQAADGEEALEKVAAADKPFDAILLDIYMPKLSGRDTFKRLREEGCTAPVIVCSGFVIDPAEFIALGAAGSGPLEVIQKPYSMSLLSRVVSTAVEAANSEPACVI